MTLGEGIETAHASNALSDLQCDIGQGYHLCRPALPEALMQWYGQHALVRHRPPMWAQRAMFGRLDSQF